MDAQKLRDEIKNIIQNKINIANDKSLRDGVCKPLRYAVYSRSKLLNGMDVEVTDTSYIIGNDKKIEILKKYEDSSRNQVMPEITLEQIKELL